MNKYFEIGILATIFVSALIFSKSVLGLAGSLRELQIQANTDAAYRNELVNYLLSHDMTVMDTRLKVNPLMNINTLETYESEAVVNDI